MELLLIDKSKKNRKVVFQILNVILLILLSQPLSAQDHEGYILCIDNFGDRDQNTNEYYFLPSDLSSKNVKYSKESLEFKDDRLESKIKTFGGLKIYKNFTVFGMEDCQGITKEHLELYLDTNSKFVYFHYENEKIDKRYFLKQIKSNKYYLARFRFKGCEIIDKNYLKSKVLKMFVYEIDEIKPINDGEKKQFIKFIEDLY